MDHLQRPVSPADYDPERQYDEAGVDPNPALDDKPAKAPGPARTERPVEPTTAYGFGGVLVREPGAASADRLEESPTWAGQEADRPSNQPTYGEQQDNAQTNATRGYAESDQRIYEAVCAGLEQHGQIDAADMTVYVAEGIVTLTGTVDDAAAKAAAEDLARGIEGVRDVRNMLYIEGGGPQPGTLPATRPHGVTTEALDETPDEVWRMQAHTGQTGRETMPQAADGQSQTAEVMATPIANAATIREGTVGQPERATVMVDPGPYAIPETAPVTAVTDEAGRTTGLKLVEGMKVVGADGASVGKVKAVREGDFLVDRPLARDVYAPFECVQDVSGDQVTLMINAAEVGDQGWANP